MRYRSFGYMFVVAAAVASVWACSGSSGARSSVTLETLRRRAQASSDPVVLRDRALAELTAPGGVSAEAVRQLERLRGRSARDPRVRFGLGLVELMHGEFAAAADDFAGAIVAAREGTDPLGPAIAEVSVGRLVGIREDVQHFPRIFRPIVDAVVSDPGNLGPAATTELMDTAVRWARERGLSDAESRWVRAAGCVTDWTVVGAFGPLPMLRFDETLGPEGTAPLAHDYDLGPGRGRRPSWQVHARGCAANLGRGRSEGGVFFAATDFVLPRDQDVALSVESPNTFAIFIDGERVAMLDGRAGSTPGSVLVPLSLAAGRHTLRVKIASRYSSPLVVATLTDVRGRAVGNFATALGGAHVRQPVLRSESGSSARAERGRPEDPFAQYLSAELAFSRRDAVAAREALRPLAVSERATPVALIAWGSIALSDGFTAPSVARDRARRAFETARLSDRKAFYPMLALARLAEADDRADEALALLREAFTRFPDNPQVQNDMAGQLMERNWDGEARAVVERAARQLPDVCWVARLRLALAQRHEDGQMEGVLAGRVRQCDALSDAAAVAAVRQRRWDDARTEYGRLLLNDPEGRGLRRALVDVTRQRGDFEAALPAAQQLLAENPEDTSLRGDIADIQAGLGRREQAVSFLDAQIAQAPSQMSELLRYRSSLSGTESLGPWRLDGRRVLRTFGASGRHYDGAAVLVLDYTVRRVMPDGSSLELTHNIFRLQSQEGVDEHATFNPPQGVTILGLRTHKADGRVLEPEAIARLDAIAFPDVHIGDAIEFEYVRALPASEVAPGGFTSDRFYFRGFEIPYDHSELVVVLPEEMAARTRIDPRGAAPVTRRREIAGGALIEYRWLAEQSERMTPEPRSVSAREFIPSIALGAEATWERFVDSLRDRLADQSPYDPEAARLAEQIAGSARNPSEKLRLLHRWVLDHIDQDGAGTPFGSAPVMLSARSGHRMRLLCYLLRFQQVSCDLALVRQANADATESTMADDDTFLSVLLRVATEQGVRWVTASDRGAPVGWLPPALAGQPALVIAPRAPRVRVPSFDPAGHSRDVTVHLTLGRDGSGRADVVERLKGAWAISWRDSLRQIDPANLEREFEGYVGRQVTAASLTTLRIEGQDDPNVDVVLRYSFSAPNVAVATAGGDGLTFDGIYPAELGPTYAQRPQRSTVMYNPEALNATLDLTVTLPSGATLGGLPPARSGLAAGVDWSVRYDRRSDGFRYVRSVRVPPGRVSPSAYPTFAAQIRAIDAADTQRVVVSLR